MAKCINVSLPEFKKLQEETGLNKHLLAARIGVWQEDNNTDEFPSKDAIINPQEVKAEMKAIQILSSDKAKQIFTKGEKNNWSLNKILTELQIPKEQKQLILDKDLTDREEIITSLLTDNSFVVEINTATKATRFNEHRNHFKIGTDRYWKDGANDVYYKNDDIISKEEFFKLRESTVEKEPSDFYSNLTVPGGTNYTENEIATPAITPSIKGHAQFATDKGIGWFRSDEQAVISKTDTEKDNIRIGQLKEMGYSEEEILEMTEKDTGSQAKILSGSKTRRILEVQSDLFQKGRDKNDLIHIEDYNTALKNINELDLTQKTLDNITSQGRFAAQVNVIYNPELTFKNEKIKSLGYYNNSFQFQWGEYGNNGVEKISKEEYLKIVNKEKEFLENNLEIQDTKNSQNQFLQLLNKNNNWVTFFVKSIIQDSVKKGYEKVLFPSGNTASKVEGHGDLEEFIKDREKSISDLKEKYTEIQNVSKIGDTFYYTKRNGKKVLETIDDEWDLKEVLEIKKDFNNQIKQFELENERVRKEGYGALKPIYNFYENTVANILKKNGYNPVEITDEYGNTWNEVNLLEVKDEIIYYHKSKNLSLSENEYKQDLEKTILDYVQKHKYVSARRSKRAGGEYHVLITDPKANWRKGMTDEQKLAVVNKNLKYLDWINSSRRSSNGEKPLIIEPISKDILNRKKLLYSVKINPAYIENEWADIKAYNDTVTELAESGIFPTMKNDSYKDVVPKHKETALDTGYDTLEETERKVEILKRNFKNATVSYNASLPNTVYGRVKGNHIEINPNYVKRDTVIHEFSHLFIDMLGGMDNPFIQRGRNLLRGTIIENEVIKEYATGKEPINGEILDKEILATAVGLAGASLHDLKESGLPGRVVAWVKILINKIRLKFKGRFGIDGNVALELASQMLNKQLNTENLTGELSNYWQNSKTTTTTEPSSIEDEKVERIISTMLKKIKILQQKYNKMKLNPKSESGIKLKEFKQQIKNLLEEIEANRNIQGIIRYVDEMDIQSKKNLEVLEEMLDEYDKSKTINSKKLKNVSSFIGVFDILPEVSKYLEYELRSIDPDKDLEKYNALKEKEAAIDAVRQRVMKINDKYDTINSEYLLQILLPHSYKKKQHYSRVYEKEFWKNNNVKRTPEKVAEMKNYVQEQLLINKDKIQAEEEADLRDKISSAPKDAVNDLTSAQSLLTDPRSMDDVAIQAVVTMLDKADLSAIHQYVNERNNISDAYEKLRLYRNNPSKMTDLYEGIIEKIDGKETGHIVGKYYSTYAKDRQDWEEGLREEGIEITKSMRANWYKENRDKYLNPQWQTLVKLPDTHPVREMYNYLTDMYARKDAITPEYYKLAKIDRIGSTVLSTAEASVDKINEITYKLPALEKNTMERLSDQNILTAGIEGIKDVFSKDSEYTESGEIIEGEETMRADLRKAIVDEKNKENQFVPIHFRGRLRKKSQQSYDLVGISLIDHHMLLNYKEKQKVSFAVEALEEHTAKRKVKLVRGSKKLISMVNGNVEYHTDEGINSNAYKAMHAMVQSRLYGISSVDMGDIKLPGGKTVSINKMFQALMGWTGNTMLVLNGVAGQVNWLQGKYQNFLESSGNIYYSREDLRKAELLYVKDSKGILNDATGALNPTSLTNLLAERFDAFSSFDGSSKRYANNTRLKRKLNGDIGHFISHSTEHQIQSTMMYALLNSTKIEDPEGNLVPLHEAYEVKDGELKIKKGYKVDENIEFKTSRKIKELIKVSHGNYDHNNQAAAQRYIAGKMGFMLRKWLVTGVQKRWRGARYVTSKDLMHADNIAYNPILETDAEGYYTTTIRFLRSVENRADLLKFSILAGKWAELTEMERANIHKTIKDMAAFMLASLAAGILKGLAEDMDDDENEFMFRQAYVFRRLHSELTFYVNPFEIPLILATPTASLSMLERVGKVARQFYKDPTEQYKRGSRKGDYKLWRETKRLLPGFAAVDREIKDVYEWLEKM